MVCHYLLWCNEVNALNRKAWLWSSLCLGESFSERFHPIFSHLLDFRLKHLINATFGPTSSSLSLLGLRVSSWEEATAIPPMNGWLPVTWSPHGAKQILIGLINEPIRQIILYLPFNITDQHLFSFDLLLHKTLSYLLLFLGQTLFLFFYIIRLIILMPLVPK